VWFLIGILAAGSIVGFSLWLRSIKVLVKWYERLFGIIGLVLLIIGLQNYWATQSEHWSKGTPLTFLLVFVIPSIILLALAAFLPGWRHFQSRKRSIGK
jgi:uncharacterized membrane protein